MAKQPSATDQREAPPQAETATAGQAETASVVPASQKPPKPKDVHQPATKARMVDARLKARHCRGGVCKEKGETMRMTAGEYERMKKHGRVE